MTIWTPQLENGAKSKYEAIADAIERDIADGTLQPGQKLPTQRALSKRLSVTIGTIGRAYALAEKQGLVSLEVGRGSYVRSFESRPGEFESGETIIDLGLNRPPESQHADLIARSLAQISHSRDITTLFGVAPVESFGRHRAAAARWMDNRLQADADEWLICSGTQNALLTSLASVTQPGDKVLVESVTFPGMIAVAKLLRLELIPVAMDERGIIPSELDQKAHDASVLYCIPTNQNPTGITMPLSRRREIAKIAKRRSLIIVEDDVYGKLVEQAPVPIATLAPERTFFVCSLAKTLSVGLRLAFVHPPGNCREAMLTHMRASNFFPSPLLCEVATNWIEGGTADQLLQEQRETAVRRQQIAKHVFDATLISGSPVGHHVWIQLPDVWTPETLERAARENGVRVFPASAFVPESSNQSGSIPNAVRIGLGAAGDDRELQIGLNVIARLLSQPSFNREARY